MEHTEHTTTHTKRNEVAMKYNGRYFHHMYIIPKAISSSIRYKLIMWVTLLVAIPILLITVISSYFSSRSMAEEIVSSNISSTRLAGKYSDEKITEMDRLLFSLLVDKEFQNNITDLNDPDTSLQFSAQKSIERKLYAIYYTNTDVIHAVSLTVYENEKNIRAGNESGYNDGGQRITELGYSGIYYVANDTAYEKFIFMRDIMRFSDREKIGVLSIEVDWSYLEDSLDLLGAEDISTIALLDRAGDVFHSPFSQGKESEEYGDIYRAIVDQAPAANHFQSNNMYVFFDQISDGNIYVVKLVPNTVIVESTMQTIKTGALVGVVAVLSSFLFVLIFSLRILKPLTSLAESMNSIERHSFTTAIRPSDRKDEIGQLQKSFFNMIARIKHLIDKEYKLEIEKKNAQIIALQSNINPHFLHNTLQLIGNMSLSNRGGQVYSVIKSLSNIFRYITRRPNSFVTIAEEMKHLQEYIHIQEMRFEGRIDVDIYVDDEASHVKLPKLCLQPIVENSFIHGFSSSTSKWQLSIVVQKVFNEVEIVITDNGTGMEKETVEAINAQLRLNLSNPLMEKDSIGIINVDSRMKLAFGIEYGVTVNGICQSGTEIKLLIPIKSSGGAGNA